MRSLFYHRGRWGSIAVAGLRCAGWLALASAPAAGGSAPAHEAAGLPLPATAPAALAAVDSLLAAGQPGLAADLAVAARGRWQADAWFGWQLDGRAGAALVAAGRAREAVPPLEAAIGARPEDGSLRHQLGLALAALGRRGRALAEFEQAALLDPAAVAPRLEAGRLRGQLGDVAGAAREFAAAAELCGGCPEPDRLLATVMLDAGRPGDAVAPLRRLLDAGGDQAVRLGLVAALAGAGEDSALLALVTARDPDEWSADEWRQAVQAEARRGGAEWAGRALTCDPDSACPGLPRDDHRFWGAVALSLLAAGRPGESLVAGDRALALHPADPTYLTNRAAALAALGREDEARRALSEAGRGDLPAQEREP